MIVGIDPGLTGAVGVLDPDGNYVDVIDIPVMATGAKSRIKNQINAAGLSRILEQQEIHVVVLELVNAMPSQGVASMFSLGDSFGTIRGVCGALKLPVELVRPASWKKHFNLGKDKDLARSLAIRLFPNAPLDRKKDHGRAEALLLARYTFERAL